MMCKTMEVWLHRAVLPVTLVMLLPACQRADDTRAADQGASPAASGTSGERASDESSGASSAIGQVSGSDTAITAKVKAALAKERKVNVSDISVETSQGEVILSGFVDSPAQMDQALKIAKSVEGVAKVTNKMKPRTP